MSWRTTYNKWSAFPELDPALKKQLEEMQGSEKELEDAFYKELTFGTGGMRGMLGPGTNRMNIYTIRKAVEGLANYVKENVKDCADRGVAIAYDSRYKSQEFAVESARVLGAHGIKAHVYESLRPTPVLSFAVRHLQAAAGIMITASHNPPEYNGFKVYNEDGGQMPPAEAAEVIANVQKVDNELEIPVASQQDIEHQGLLNWIGKEVDAAYLEQLKTISRMNPGNQDYDSSLQIVFTPLHGTAHDMVLNGLQQLGFKHVHVVEEQAKPDPEFSTVDSPNPEEHQAFTLAIQQGKQRDADILVGTDPDADRLGVAVKDGKGSYQVLTGNQLGTLMLDYLLSHTSESDRQNGKMIKTIVTTELGRTVASHYGVETIDTLTGFKYIGEKIKGFESTDESFLFGYEESYGYLIGDFVRDKDAVQSTMIACEMASYWKQKGKTLLEALEGLYEQHGFYFEDMSSLTLKGKDGAEQIAAIMEDIRENPLTEIGGLEVIATEDYQTSERRYVQTGKIEQIDLPAENVVKYLLDKDGWVCLRPSGTEPKIKCYYGVSSSSRQDSQQLLEQLKQQMKERIDAVIQA
ncbi:phospho-sugar mutase [Sediminibacillus halophilus]|uniref:Phosphoglucomutase n=1 Tax=Sediminibacillus halophilus TaxID=482461 RepID=A0A1G9TT46_9BACI|nr:phospho-sugar mutase [Sediminibacillus halophilus]SDM50886.1 phosphoglucomutase [Sediminibacillus halophilus]